MKLPQIKGRFTWPDFPEQDWKLWEARKFSRPPDGATIDTSYMDTRPCCIHCATWICAGCWDWRRSRATRAVSQYCGGCGSTEGFFSAVRHYHDHMALPMVPFLVPVINDERASIVRQLEEALGDRLKARAAADRVFSTACPAGDPCPATGCPACCPTYDPCGEKSCRNCNPGGEMHVPEEAEILNEDQGAPDEVLDEASETPIADAALAAGFPVSQDHEILPHVVKTVTDIIRDAYAQGAQGGDKVLLTVLEAQELCNLAVQAKYQDSDVVETALRKVLAEAKKREARDNDGESGYPFKDTDDTIVIGPECFAQPDREIISWQGENYYRAVKPTELKDDPEVRKQYMRRDAMDWSVRLHEKALGTGLNIGTPSVISGAQQILDWMTDGKMPPGA